MNNWSAPRNATQTRRWSGSAGFTLIELMIVIVILAILVGVATPSLIGYMRQRGVREAADQLSMDMQRAKLLAISRNANCSIIVNTANNSYTISLTNEIVSLDRYRGGVTFLAPIPDPPRITFNAQGLCTEMGPLLLTNADGIAILELRTTLAGGISQH